MLCNSFKKRLPSEDKKQHRNSKISRSHINPDLDGQRREERKEVWILLVGLGEQDTDSQRHEGHREIHGSSPVVSDCQVANGQICSLEK